MYKNGYFLHKYTKYSQFWKVLCRLHTKIKKNINLVSKIDKMKDICYSLIRTRLLGVCKAPDNLLWRWRICFVSPKPWFLGGIVKERQSLLAFVWTAAFSRTLGNEVVCCYDRAAFGWVNRISRIVWTNDSNSCSEMLTAIFAWKTFCFCVVCLEVFAWGLNKFVYKHKIRWVVCFVGIVT